MRGDMQFGVYLAIIVVGVVGYRNLPNADDAAVAPTDAPAVAVVVDDDALTSEAPIAPLASPPPTALEQPNIPPTLAPLAITPDTSAALTDILPNGYAPPAAGLAAENTAATPTPVMEDIASPAPTDEAPTIMTLPALTTPNVEKLEEPTEPTPTIPEMAEPPPVAPVIAPSAAPALEPEPAMVDELVLPPLSLTPPPPPPRVEQAAKNDAPPSDDHPTEPPPPAPLVAPGPSEEGKSVSRPKVRVTDRPLRADERDPSPLMNPFRTGRRPVVESHDIPARTTGGQPVHPFYQRYLDQKEYFVREGETLSAIADRLYGDPTMAESIRRLNPKSFDGLGEPRAGARLKLP